MTWSRRCIMSSDRSARRPARGGCRGYPGAGRERVWNGRDRGRVGCAVQRPRPPRFAAAGRGSVVGRAACARSNLMVDPQAPASSRATDRRPPTDCARRGTRRFGQARAPWDGSASFSYQWRHLASLLLGNRSTRPSFEDSQRQPNGAISGMVAIKRDGVITIDPEFALDD